VRAKKKLVWTEAHGWTLAAGDGSPTLTGGAGWNRVSWGRPG
jgi:hypothetical protein